MKALNLLGQRFGLLVVEARAQSTATGNARWLCRCDCGIEKIAHASGLRSGETTSCGCSHGVGAPSALNDIQKAEARRRHDAGEKHLSIALDLGVSEATIRRHCARPRQEDRHALGTAIHLATQAAALFGLTLEQIQAPAARGAPQKGSAVHHARAAAVAAMRVGDRPIAWGVVEAVMASGGGEHRRLVLQKILRRAGAAPAPIDARKVG